MQDGRQTPVTYTRNTIYGVHLPTGISALSQQVQKWQMNALGPRSLIVSRAGKVPILHIAGGDVVAVATIGRLCPPRRRQQQGVVHGFNRCLQGSVEPKVAGIPPVRWGQMILHIKHGDFDIAHVPANVQIDAFVGQDTIPSRGTRLGNRIGVEKWTQTSGSTKRFGILQQEIHRGLTAQTAAHTKGMGGIGNCAKLPINRRLDNIDDQISVRMGERRRGRLQRTVFQVPSPYSG
jgi:hypothetical protein